MTQKTNGKLEVIKGLISLVALLVIASNFPAGGVFIQNGHLISFWLVPIAFFVIAAFFSFVAESGSKIPFPALFLYESLANGTWLGLSLGAVLILNEWYDNPDNGRLEPLFTATGLSSAGVLAAETWLREQLVEKKTAE